MKAKSNGTRAPRKRRSQATQAGKHTSLYLPLETYERYTFLKERGINMSLIFRNILEKETLRELKALSKSNDAFNAEIFALIDEQKNKLRDAWRTLAEFEAMMEPYRPSEPIDDALPSELGEAHATGSVQPIEYKTDHPE